MTYRRNGGSIAGPAVLITLGLALMLVLGVGGRNLVHAEAEWNDVILIYHTDCKGLIDPCG